MPFPVRPLLYLSYIPFFLFALSLCWMGMTLTAPLFFLFFLFLHHPLFLCILMAVSSLTSSYFCLTLSFVSYHPSILLSGWPKSWAVLELCSGRDKLSVALCSHTYPLLSQCIDCAHENDTERRWGWGAKGERERWKKDWEMCNVEHCRQTDQKNKQNGRSHLKTMMQWK